MAIIFIPYLRLLNFLYIIYDKVSSKEASDTLIQKSEENIMADDGRGYYQGPDGNYYQTEGDGSDANKGESK